MRIDSKVRSRHPSTVGVATFAAVAHRDEIVAWADEYLDLASYPDYGPMGLQVVGAAEVRKLVCGVSASRELFERAAEAGAQMVLVHHGLFWEKPT